MFTWCFPSIASPTSSRAGAAHDIRERNTELQPEATGVSAKSMETLEGMGGVRVPVRGLRTHDGPSTGTGTPLAYTSHDPTLTVSRATDNDSPELGHHDYTSEPQGLQSTVGLEDGHRILGHNNILPRHPKECFLHLKWVPLKDKILVCSRRFSTLSVWLSNLMLAYRRFCCRFTPLLSSPLYRSRSVSFRTSAERDFRGFPNRLGRGWTCYDRLDRH